MFDFLKRWIPGRDEIRTPGQTAKLAVAMLRREYHGKPFDESTALRDPVEQFGRWFDQAVKAVRDDPNAMILGTSNSEGNVTTRTVLLKGFDENGFLFYTNYESRKGRQISVNPSVSLTFYWPDMVRQVHVEGEAKMVSAEQSDNYFHSRPRSSQIAARASTQSRTLKNRQELENRYREIEKEFTGRQIPRPENWGGYLVKPDSFEFWQGRINRLHDRIYYQKQGDVWKISRLMP